MSASLRSAVVAVVCACSSQPAVSGKPARVSPPAPSGIVGLWSAIEEYGPAIRGPVHVDGRAPAWKARVGGAWVDAEHSGSDVRFSVLDSGAFRGVVADDKRTIRGHWTHHGGLLLNATFASPIELVADRVSLWKGAVETIDTSLRYYVDIRASSDGSMTAVFRNTERNLLGNRLFEVKRTGDAVELTSVKSLAWSKKTVQFGGRYDAARDRLMLEVWGPGLLTLEFQRAATSIGFTARDGVGAPYAYHPPEQLADGWTTGSLDDVGLAREPIVALIRSILDADPRALDTQAIHSLLIARRGKLVLEEYFYGLDRERPHDMRSATKTLAPMLVAAAREHGVAIDATTRVYDLFQAKYAPFANWDERKREITIEHFMSNRSGLACDDNDASSPGEEDRMSRERDWYKYILDLPMVRPPGGDLAVYCTASLVMVGGAVEQASGMWTADLFERYIARPLQFGRYHLALAPTGQVHSGGGAYLRPRDSLKLGQLYLNGGTWNGKRVLARDWVERSIQSHGKFGDDPEPAAAFHDYGYGWHILMMTAGGRSYRTYSAEGNGGQWVLVIPEAELVVAANGGNYTTPWFHWVIDHIPGHVLAAMQ
jgi:CubicO group peptidase (beta-lactamase class C family)